MFQISFEMDNVFVQNFCIGSDVGINFCEKRSYSLYRKFWLIVFIVFSCFPVSYIWWWWSSFLANRLEVSSQISWLCFMITKLWWHFAVACTFLLGLAAVLLLVLLEDCLKQIFEQEIKGLKISSILIMSKEIFLQKSPQHYSMMNLGNLVEIFTWDHIWRFWY